MGHSAEDPGRASARYEACFGGPERHGWRRVVRADGPAYERSELRVRALLTRADRWGERQLTVSVTHGSRLPTGDELLAVRDAFVGAGVAVVVAPALVLRNTMHLFRAYQGPTVVAEPSLAMAVGG